MDILVILLTLLLLVAQDMRNTKNRSDKFDELFDLKGDWLMKRYDDLLVIFLWGMIGGMLSNELGVPLLKKYTDLDPMGDKAMHLSGTFVATYFFAKVAPKLLNGSGNGRSKN